jgi:hypothetical protein
MYSTMDLVRQCFDSDEIGIISKENDWESPAEGVSTLTEERIDLAREEELLDCLLISSYTHTARKSGQRNSFTIKRLFSKASRTLRPDRAVGFFTRL